MMQGAKMVGAGKIITPDPNPARVAMARKFGMTHFIRRNGDATVQSWIGHRTRLMDAGLCGEIPGPTQAPYFHLSPVFA
jgi:S-(hydroxymethyl)glutathione dehydrogenase/alcohol dehydrogenase